MAHHEIALEQLPSHHPSAYNVTYILERVFPNMPGRSGLEHIQEKYSHIGRKNGDGWWKSFDPTDTGVTVWRITGANHPIYPVTPPKWTIDTISEQSTPTSVGILYRRPNDRAPIMQTVWVTTPPNDRGIPSNMVVNRDFYRFGTRQSILPARAITTKYEHPAPFEQRTAEIVCSIPLIDTHGHYKQPRLDYILQTNALVLVGPKQGHADLRTYEYLNPMCMDVGVRVD